MSENYRFEKTGIDKIDREIRTLELEAKVAQETIDRNVAKADALWFEHAPHHAPDGTRIRGGNSGGWE